MTNNGGLSIDLSFNLENTQSTKEAIKRFANESAMGVNEEFATAKDAIARVTQELAKSAKLQGQNLKEIEAYIEELNKKYNESYGAQKEYYDMVRKNAIDEKNALKQNIEAIEELQQYTKGLNKEFGTIVTRIRNMRSQYMTTIQTMKQLEESGKTNTDQYRKLSEEAEALQEQLVNLTKAQRVANKEIALMGTPTAKIQAVVQGLSGITSAFGVAQGAMALFGKENEDLAKVMTKLQGVMSITIGLQQTARILDKKSASNIILLGGLKKWWNKVLEDSNEALEDNTKELAKNSVAMGTNSATTATATASTKGFAKAWNVLKNAIKSAPFAIAIAGITAIVSMYRKFTEATREAKKEHEEMMKKVSESTASNISKYMELKASWESVGKSIKERGKWLDDHKEKLSAIGVELDDINEAERFFSEEGTQNYVNAVIARAKADAYREKITENVKKQIELEDKKSVLDKQVEAGKTEGAGMKSQGTGVGGGAVVGAVVGNIINQIRSSRTEIAINELEAENKKLVELSLEQDKIYDDLMSPFTPKKSQKTKKTKANKDFSSTISGMLEQNMKDVAYMMEDDVEREKETLKVQRDIEKEHTLSMYDELEKAGKMTEELQTAKNNRLLAIDKKYKEGIEKIDNDISTKATEENEKRKKYLDDLVSKYGTIQDKINLINEQLKEDIQKAKESGASDDVIESMKKDASERISSLLFGGLKDGDLKGAFGDIEKLSRKTMVSMIKSIKALKKENFSKEDWDAIQKVQDKLVGLVASGSIEHLAESIKSINEYIDVFGDSVDETTAQVLSDFNSIADSATELATSIATGNIAGVIDGSVKLVGDIMNAISDMIEYGINEQIKKSEEYIDRLEKQIDRVERKLRNTAGGSEYKNAIDEKLSLLKKEYETLKFQYEYEQEKAQKWYVRSKKAQELIDESSEVWDKMVSIRDEISDVVSEYYDTLFGTNAVNSVNELSDALMSAFEQGTDSAKQWGKSVDDTIKNIVKSYIKQKYVVDKLTPLLDSMFGSLRLTERKTLFGKLIFGDDTTSVVQSIISLYRDKIEELGLKAGEQIQMFYDAFGLDDMNDTNKLAGAIGSLSEETGGLIAGRMNAMVINQSQMTDVMREQLLVQYAISNNTSVMAERLNSIEENVIEIANRQYMMPTSTNTAMAFGINR